MLSKNKISFIKSLHHKKFREEEQLFLAEGRKVVDELLSSVFRVASLIATRDYLDSLSSSVLNSISEVIEVKPSDLERITALTTPQDVLAVVHTPDRDIATVNMDKGITLVLDDVRDPGNMGTLIRLAHWFGVSQVVCSLNSVDAFHPKVVQSSMGAVFHVPVFEVGLEGWITDVKAQSNIPIYAMVMDGQNIYRELLSENALLILGNESQGIRTSLVDLSTRRVTIPSYEQVSGQRPESLNVAVSAAVALAELRRK